MKRTLVAAVAALAIGSSPAALAYQPPDHWTHIKIHVVLPADSEPPLRPGDITVADPDPDITDIPLPDPDPATTALKLTGQK
jgi:hypothetical protein